MSRLLIFMSVLSVDPIVRSEVWPRPQVHIKYDNYYVLKKSDTVRVEIVNHKCDIITNALKRLKYEVYNKNSKFQYNKNTGPTIIETKTGNSEKISTRKREIKFANDVSPSNLNKPDTNSDPNIESTKGNSQKREKKIADNVAPINVIKSDTNADPNIESTKGNSQNRDTKFADDVVPTNVIKPDTNSDPNIETKGNDQKREKKIAHDAAPINVTKPHTNTDPNIESTKGNSQNRETKFADDVAPTNVIKPDTNTGLNIESTKGNSQKREIEFGDDVAPTNVTKPDTNTGLNIESTKGNSQKREIEFGDDVAPTNVTKPDTNTDPNIESTNENSQKREIEFADDVAPTNVTKPDTNTDPNIESTTGSSQKLSRGKREIKFADDVPPKLVIEPEYENLRHLWDDNSIKPQLKSLQELWQHHDSPLQVNSSEISNEKWILNPVKRQSSISNLWPMSSTKTGIKNSNEELKNKQLTEELALTNITNCKKHGQHNDYITQMEKDEITTNTSERWTYDSRESHSSEENISSDEDETESSDVLIEANDRYSNELHKESSIEMLISHPDNYKNSTNSSKNITSITQNSTMSSRNRLLIQSFGSENVTANLTNIQKTSEDEPLQIKLHDKRSRISSDTDIMDDFNGFRLNISNEQQNNFQKEQLDILKQSNRLWDKNFSNQNSTDSSNKQQLDISSENWMATSTARKERNSSFELEKNRQSDRMIILDEPEESQNLIDHATVDVSEKLINNITVNASDIIINNPTVHVNENWMNNTTVNASGNAMNNINMNANDNWVYDVPKKKSKVVNILWDEESTEESLTITPETSIDTEPLNFNEIPPDYLNESRIIPNDIFGNQPSLNTNEKITKSVELFVDYSNKSIESTVAGLKNLNERRINNNIHNNQLPEDSSENMIKISSKHLIDKSNTKRSALLDHDTAFYVDYKGWLNDANKLTESIVAEQENLNSHRNKNTNNKISVNPSEKMKKNSTQWLTENSTGKPSQLLNPNTVVENNKWLDNTSVNSSESAINNSTRKLREKSNVKRALLLYPNTTLTVDSNESLVNTKEKMMKSSNEQLKGKSTTIRSELFYPDKVFNADGNLWLDNSPLDSILMKQKNFNGSEINVVKPNVKTSDSPSKNIKVNRTEQLTEKSYVTRLASFYSDDTSTLIESTLAEQGNLNRRRIKNTITNNKTSGNLSENVTKNSTKQLKANKESNVKQSALLYPDIAFNVDNTEWSDDTNSLIESTAAEQKHLNSRRMKNIITNNETSVNSSENVTTNLNKQLKESALLYPDTALNTDVNEWLDDTNALVELNVAEQEHSNIHSIQNTSPNNETLASSSGYVTKNSNEQLRSSLLYHDDTAFNVDKNEWLNDTNTLIESTVEKQEHSNARTIKNIFNNEPSSNLSENIIKNSTEQLLEKPDIKGSALLYSVPFNVDNNEWFDDTNPLIESNKADKKKLKARRIKNTIPNNGTSVNSSRYVIKNSTKKLRQKSNVKRSALLYTDTALNIDNNEWLDGTNTSAESTVAEQEHLNARRIKNIVYKNETSGNLSGNMKKNSTEQLTEKSTSSRSALLYPDTEFYVHNNEWLDNTNTLVESAVVEQENLSERRIKNNIPNHKISVSSSKNVKQSSIQQLREKSNIKQFASLSPDMALTVDSKEWLVDSSTWLELPVKGKEILNVDKINNTILSNQPSSNSNERVMKISISEKSNIKRSALLHPDATLTLDSKEWLDYSSTSIESITAQQEKLNKRNIENIVSNIQPSDISSENTTKNSREQLTEKSNLKELASPSPNKVFTDDSEEWLVDSSNSIELPVVEKHSSNARRNINTNSNNLSSVNVSENKAKSSDILTEKSNIKRSSLFYPEQSAALFPNATLTVDSKEWIIDSSTSIERNNSNARSISNSIPNNDLSINLNDTRVKKSSEQSKDKSNIKQSASRHTVKELKSKEWLDNLSASIESTSAETKNLNERRINNTIHNNDGSVDFSEYMMIISSNELTKKSVTKQSASLSPDLAFSVDSKEWLDNSNSSIESTVVGQENLNEYRTNNTIFDRQPSENSSKNEMQILTMQLAEKPNLKRFVPLSPDSAFTVDSKEWMDYSNTSIESATARQEYLNEHRMNNTMFNNLLSVESSEDTTKNSSEQLTEKMYMKRFASLAPKIAFTVDSKEWMDYSNTSVESAVVRQEDSNGHRINNTMFNNPPSVHSNKHVTKSSSEQLTEKNHMKSAVSLSEIAFTMDSKKRLSDSNSSVEATIAKQKNSSKRSINNTITNHQLSVNSTANVVNNVSEQLKEKSDSPLLGLFYPDTAFKLENYELFDSSNTSNELTVAKQEKFIKREINNTISNNHASVDSNQNVIQNSSEPLPEKPNIKSASLYLDTAYTMNSKEWLDYPKTSIKSTVPEKVNSNERINNFEKQRSVNSGDNILKNSTEKLTEKIDVELSSLLYPDTSLGVDNNEWLQNSNTALNITVKEKLKERSINNTIRNHQQSVNIDENMIRNSTELVKEKFNIKQTMSLYPDIAFNVDNKEWLNISNTSTESTVVNQENLESFQSNIDKSHRKQPSVNSRANIVENSTLESAAKSNVKRSALLYPGKPLNVNSKEWLDDVDVSFEPIVRMQENLNIFEPRTDNPSKQPPVYSSANMLKITLKPFTGKSNMKESKSFYPDTALGTDSKEWLDDFNTSFEVIVAKQGNTQNNQQSVNSSANLLKISPLDLTEKPKIKESTSFYPDTTPYIDSEEWLNNLNTSIKSTIAKKFERNVNNTRSNQSPVNSTPQVIKKSPENLTGKSEIKGSSSLYPDIAVTEDSKELCDNSIESTISNQVNLKAFERNANNTLTYQPSVSSSAHMIKKSTEQVIGKSNTKGSTFLYHDSPYIDSEEWSDDLKASIKSTVAKQENLTALERNVNKLPNNQPPVNSSAQVINRLPERLTGKSSIIGLTSLYPDSANMDSKGSKTLVELTVAKQGKRRISNRTNKHSLVNSNASIIKNSTGELIRKSSIKQSVTLYPSIIVDSNEWLDDSNTSESTIAKQENLNTFGNGASTQPTVSPSAKPKINNTPSTLPTVNPSAKSKVNNKPSTKLTVNPSANVIKQLSKQLPDKSNIKRSPSLFADVAFNVDNNEWLDNSNTSTESTVEWVNYTDRLTGTLLELKPTTDTIEHILTSNSMDTGSTSEFIDNLSTRKLIDSLSTRQPTNDVSMSKTIDNLSTLKPIDDLSKRKPTDALSTHIPNDDLSTSELYDGLTTSKSRRKPTTKPTDGISSRKPIDDLSTIKPIDDLLRNKPIESLSTHKPVDGLWTIAPIEDLSAIKPIDDISESKPVDYPIPIKPIEDILAHKPIDYVLENTPIIELMSSKPTDTLPAVSFADQQAEYNQLYTLLAGTLSPWTEEPYEFDPMMVEASYFELQPFPPTVFKTNESSAAENTTTTETTETTETTTTTETPVTTETATEPNTTTTQQTEPSEQQVTFTTEADMALDRDPFGLGAPVEIFNKLIINLTKPCETMPYFNMKEHYTLVVKSGEATVSSSSVWGIIRGLFTFRDLFYTVGNERRINQTEIRDEPRYSHRGLMLDTAIHYVPVKNILYTLDAMAMNKLNVFHWHIVDDESFPYVSNKYPRLSEKGAYFKTMVYNKTDIKKIVDYARDLGIRVIAEFTIPGHTRSWGKAYPNLLTKCYSGKQVSRLGPMNPIRDETYSFLAEFIAEVHEDFPDQFVYFGGNEIDMSCWNSNPDIVDYIGYFGVKSVNELLILFMRNVLPLYPNGTSIIFWEDVFQANVPLPADAVIQLWKKDFWRAKIASIVFSNYKAILTWNFEDEHAHIYDEDPREAVNCEKETCSNILGGEASLLGNMVNFKNNLGSIWEKVSTVAELLWSAPPSSLDLSENNDRVSEKKNHVCDMIRNGLPAKSEMKKYCNRD